VIRYATEGERLLAGKGEVARANVDTEEDIREIILFKRPTGTSLSHEISHFTLGHMDSSEEDSISLYISDEVDAWIDTYRKLKRPRHLTNRLRALISIATESGELNLRQSLYLIGKELQKRGVPKAWKSDFRNLEKEVKDVS